MAATKTRPTAASVAAYIASRASEEQAADCASLMRLLKRITGESPHMWGPSIVGYGTYHYVYASGHSGDAPVVGFAIRGRDLVLYVMVDDAAQRARLARLGKHRMGTTCLYFKRLADLDRALLEEIVTASVAAVRAKYPAKAR